MTNTRTFGHSRDAFAPTINSGATPTVNRTLPLTTRRAWTITITVLAVFAPLVVIDAMAADAEPAILAEALDLQSVAATSSGWRPSSSPRAP